MINVAGKFPPVETIVESSSFKIIWIEQCLLLKLNILREFSAMMINY